MFFSNLKYRAVVKFIASLLILDLCLFPQTLSAFDNSTIPDQSSHIERFFDDLSLIVKDHDSLEAVQDAIKDKTGILTIFLNDMISVMAEFEAQKIENPNLTPAENFVKRWSNIDEICNACDTFFPVLERILFKFSDAMENTIDTGNPLNGVTNFYQKQSTKDLDGFEALFQLPWPEPENRRLHVFEIKKDKISKGFDQSFIIQRQVIKSINGKIIFAEFILQDELAYIYVADQEITILHEALTKLLKDNINLDAIQFVQHYIDLITKELNLALQNGDLDDYTYKFLHDPVFQARELAISKHPLLKPPYSPTEFEVLKYYRH